MSTVLAWLQAHALVAACVALAVALLLPALIGWARARRTKGRTPAAVVVAALAALACTAYSGDTSWRFAEHYLGMVDPTERAGLFLAAELALFGCALAARQNLRTTGAPGTPGVLVWAITGVQVIPAYSESGVVGGTVRAVVGPVLAAVMWHLAMGIELRHQSGDDSNSLPALLGRELRERLLSRLGLAVRDRSAAQITRDRATARAVQLAARPSLGRWGRARLAAAVARSGVGTDEGQRHVLLDQLAARRGALTLQTVDLPSPFEPPAAVEPVAEVPALPPARPPVIPPGARCLPLVARPDHSTRRYLAPARLTELVTSPPPVVGPWADKPKVDLTTTRPDPVTAALPAGTTRHVVTQTITRTPADLRREARRLNREAVRSTHRPVTIQTLQAELGLSRREATELRRDIAGGERS
ncbi:hypothetical protein ABZ439_11475 [Streptomyces sp. NPDC005840]|uniref:hypothetical protein n=1 Tax=Streptomyces sp. NPDC005840 TaxID=3157072 RepID=UPI0033DC6B7B